MLKNDPFKKGSPKVKADYNVRSEEPFLIDGVEIKFRHFPGHTPGNSVIEIDDVWFSGDFLFRDAIGRWDFPYSNPEDMIKSLKKLSKIEGDYKLLPGHGGESHLSQIRRYINFWIDYVQKTFSN
jgi:glyoxylase-like metal-dependent hydrolase (beta-lactamase superfamily II)